MKLSQAIKEFVALKQARGPRAAKTGLRYESILRIFCLCMHDPEVEDLDFTHVLWYFGELERLGWKPNGRNLVAVGLRKFFEFCNLRGWEVFNEQLIPLPERETNIPRVTDLNTFRKLVDILPKKTNRPQHIRNRALLLLLWDTGARTGELVSLDVPDLDLEKRTAIIKTEKSRGRRPIRQIFWTPETNEAIKKWLEKKEALQRLFSFADPDALFTSINKCPQLPVRGKRMTNRGVAEVMRMLSNQAGLPVVLNAHRARHSMGRDAVKTLRSNSGVSNILGHSNLDSSFVYTMVWGEDLREEWDEVMKYRGNPAEKPVAQPPKAATNFPRFKSRQPVLGKLRPLTINTGKRGKLVRSQFDR